MAGVLFCLVAFSVLFSFTLLSKAKGLFGFPGYIIFVFEKSLPSWP